MQADVLPTVRLNEIFRQAQKSMIVQNAHRIVEGQMPIKGGRDDDFFMIASTGLACQRLICDLVSTCLLYTSPQRSPSSRYRHSRKLCKQSYAES